MIKSDQQAREVQERYAANHIGLAPAVRRYLHRVHLEPTGSACGDTIDYLKLPIGRTRQREIPKITPIPSTMEELQAFLEKTA